MNMNVTLPNGAAAAILHSFSTERLHQSEHYMCISFETQAHAPFLGSVIIFLFILFTFFYSSIAFMVNIKHRSCKADNRGLQHTYTPRTKYKNKYVTVDNNRYALGDYSGDVCNLDLSQIGNHQ